MNNTLVIKTLINEEERSKMYKILYIGVSAYSRLLDEMQELTKSESFSEIRTRLLSFVIKRQFESDILTLDFPFKIKIKNVNSFNNKALFLENDLVKIQVSKTSKARRLHNSNKASRYMLNEAKRNSKHEKDIIFLFDDYNNVSIVEENSTFVVLGYGITGKEIDHLDFMIPNTKMTESIEIYNGLDEYTKMLSLNAVDKTIERKIMSLKEEAKKLVN